MLWRMCSLLVSDTARLHALKPDNMHVHLAMDVALKRRAATVSWIKGHAGCWISCSPGTRAASFRTADLWNRIGNHTCVLGSHHLGRQGPRWQPGRRQGTASRAPHGNPSSSGCALLLVHRPTKHMHRASQGLMPASVRSARAVPISFLAEERCGFSHECPAELRREPGGLLSLCPNCASAVAAISQAHTPCHGCNSWVWWTRLLIQGLLQRQGRLHEAPSLVLPGVTVMTC